MTATAGPANVRSTEEPHRDGVGIASVVQMRPCDAARNGEVTFRTSSSVRAEEVDAEHAEHALSIVVFSALIAALPAFAIGLALLDQPGFRSMVEARVCAPGENVGFRLRTTGGRQSQTAHCHGPDRVYGERNVMGPVLWAATRITWPPTTGVVALVWGAGAIARRGRRGAQLAATASAAPGTGRRVEEVVAPGITRTVEQFTIPVAGAHADLVQRLVSSKQPQLDDVHRLLESLRASGDLPAGIGVLRPGGADPDAVRPDDVRPDDVRPDDVGASLRRLRALRDEGLINRTEYEERRKAILERI